MPLRETLQRILTDYRDVVEMRAVQGSSVGAIHLRGGGNRSPGAMGSIGAGLID